MKKNILIIGTFFIILFLFILSGNMNFKNIGNKIELSKKDYDSSRNIFKNNSVESIVEKFEETSKKNKIKIEKFEKLNYEGRVFYYSKILEKKGSSYMIEYTGLDIGGLFLKVDSISGENLSDLEKFILNLIIISDNRIEEDEARKLYTQLLLNLPEKEIVNVITYENGLDYGLKIDKENGQFIFFIQ